MGFPGKFEQKNCLKFTIPGENLKRLKDTDLEISGDTSDRFLSAITSIVSKLAGGVFCDALFGLLVRESDPFLGSRDAKTFRLGSTFSKFGSFLLFLEVKTLLGPRGLIAFRTGNIDCSRSTSTELGPSAGFWELETATGLALGEDETAALEAVTFLGFWEAKRAF